MLSRRGTNQGTRSRWHGQRVQQPGNREDDINDDDDANGTRGENDPAFFEPRRPGLQPFTDGGKYARWCVSNNHKNVKEIILIL